MTEQEFITRFTADQKAGQNTWVSGGISQGIAAGLEGEVISLTSGSPMPLAGAKFIPPPWESNNG